MQKETAETYPTGRRDSASKPDDHRDRARKEKLNAARLHVARHRREETQTRELCAVLLIPRPAHCAGRA
jgi:hypothetical protein